MTTMFRTFRWTLLLVLVAMGLAQAAGAQEPVQRRWGVGWDDGLTLRGWLGGRYELALAAGPDDYLFKDETRIWDSAYPSDLQGRLQVPQDQREEHGWVRVQAGRLVLHRRELSAVAFLGLTYEWIDHQELRLSLDDLEGTFDTYELDRFTHHWALSFGIRPAWQVMENLTIETAFGLRFTWDSWDQTVVSSFAGGEGSEREITSGHGRSFSDQGWEGLTSLQFVIWF